MKQAKIESAESLQPEIEKQIEGAKKAYEYFNWLVQAQQATLKIVEDQRDYAKEQLDKLQDEKNRKFKDAGSLALQSAD